MSKQIYLNLPVKDLERSKEFFSQLGFTFNEQFTDEKAACLVIGDNIFAMLLNEKFFQSFSNKEIPDTGKTSQVLIAIDAESKESVDDLVQKALDAGGSTYNEPQDHGWMYQNAFEDLDGHQWEVMYADMSKFPEE